MKLHPHLWFKSQAEEAMQFYTSVFKDSKVLGSTNLPDPELSTVRFELAGPPIVALNANSHVPYNEAFFFLVETENQDETDYFWNALTADGGKEQPCGWLTDKQCFWWFLDARGAIAGRRRAVALRRRREVISFINAGAPSPFSRHSAIFGTLRSGSHSS